MRGIDHFSPPSFFSFLLSFRNQVCLVPRLRSSPPFLVAEGRQGFSFLFFLFWFFFPRLQPTKKGRVINSPPPLFPYIRRNVFEARDHPLTTPLFFLELPFFPSLIFPGRGEAADAPLFSLLFPCPPSVREEMRFLPFPQQESKEQQ